MGMGLRDGGETWNKIPYIMAFGNERLYRNLLIRSTSTENPEIRRGHLCDGATTAEGWPKGVDAPQSMFADASQRRFDGLLFWSLGSALTRRRARFRAIPGLDRRLPGCRDLHPGLTAAPAPYTA